MTKESLRKKTVSGVGWKFGGSIASYGITFLVGIVLARLLSPDEYGLIGIITIFITIFNGIVDGGLSTAIIRKNDATDEDYSTVFITNLVTSIILFVILYFCAPSIALFFKRQELVNLTRVMGSCVIINALSLIQQTILIKELDFKTQAKCSIISSILSGLIGIGMALMGFKVWSLVGQQISKILFYTVCVWILRSWWPRLVFSWNSFKGLWNFGWKILVSGLISNLWNEIYQVVIGKFYSPYTLGQYTKGREYVNLVSQNLTQVVQTVSYPTLSKIQDDKERLRNGYRTIIRVTMLVTFVLVLGMAACAKQFILVLIGEKWLPCVPLMQLTCFSAMLFPLHAINLNMLQVQGRSDLFLKLEIIKKFVFIPPILIGIFLNIYWMLFASFLCGCFAYYLNAYYSGSFLDYSIKDQIRDILPSFSISSTMAIVVYVLSFLPINNYILLPIQIIIGAVIVIALCEKNKLPEYYECQEMAKTYLRKVVH